MPCGRVCRLAVYLLAKLKKATGGCRTDRHLGGIYTGTLMLTSGQYLTLRVPLRLHFARLYEFSIGCREGGKSCCACVLPFSSRIDMAQDRWELRRDKAALNTLTH